MSAADRIRASIEALPEEARTAWVRYERYGAATPFINAAGGWPIANADHASGDPASVGAHIALLASPHVATALADLLDALKEPTEKPVNAIAWLDEIILAGRALEAAVDRSGT